MSANTGDADQVKKAAEKEKVARNQEVVDMQELLALPSGRRTLWRYISGCGVFRTSFVGDVNAAIFNEGARNVGLKIIDDVMTADPDAFVLMQKEAKKREDSNA